MHDSRCVDQSRVVCRCRHCRALSRGLRCRGLCVEPGPWGAGGIQSFDVGPVQFQLPPEDISAEAQRATRKLERPKDRSCIETSDLTANDATEVVCACARCPKLDPCPQPAFSPQSLIACWLSRR